MFAPMPAPEYLEGELTGDYGAKGQRTYDKGDGLAGAINEAHNGRNMGQNPVKILAVFIGREVLRPRLQRSNSQDCARAGAVL